jgi:hypothetical protein
MELGEAGLGIGVDEGLPIDLANPFQRANREGVPRAAETSKRNRPLKVDQFVALPANADSETYGADPPGPFRDEARFWMKVGDWRRNGLQAGLKTARKAHERALKSKAFVRIESFDEANRLRQGAQKPVHVLAAQQGNLGAGVHET